jgi:hypothetical protein
MRNANGAAVIKVCYGCGYPVWISGLCASCRSVEVISFDRFGETVQKRWNARKALRKL